MSQGWAEGAQTLEGKQIGPEWNDDVIGRDEGGAVDGTEIGADISQNHRRVHFFRPCLHHGPERGQHPKRAIQIGGAEGVWPFAGQGILKARQREVTGNQFERRGDFLEGGRPHIPNLQQRLDAGENSPASLPLLAFPQPFHLLFVQKRGRQIGLRIQVTGEHPVASLRENPGQVVDQGRFADPALVIEEGQHRDRHDKRLRMVTWTKASSTLNSGSG